MADEEGGIRAGKQKRRIKEEVMMEGRIAVTRKSQASEGRGFGGGREAGVKG